MEATKKLNGKAVGKWLSNNAIIMMMLAITLIVGIIHPNFFSGTNMINLFKNVSIRYIIALGISGCLITTGNDLSAGRLAGFAACLACIFAQTEGASGKFYPNMPTLSTPVVFILVIAICAIVGLCNGLVVSYLKVQPFIATLGMQQVVYGICLVYTGGTPIGSLNSNFTALAKDTFLAIPVLIWFALIVAFCFWFLYNKTRHGKYMYAIGGNEAAAEVAGVNDTNSLVFIFLQFAFGVSAGFCVITSYYVGMHDERGVRRSLATQLLLSAALTVVLTALALVLLDPMLAWINVTPAHHEVYTAAHTYCAIIFAGIGAQLFYNFICSFLRAMGDSVTPLLFLLFSTVLNVGLDLAFILVFRWGVAGAALATVLAQLVSTIGCFIYAFVRYPVLRLHREDWRITLMDVKRHLTRGIPLGLQFSVLAIGIIVMQGGVVKFDMRDGVMVSNAAQNGFGAANRLFNLVATPMNALGGAMTSFTAQNLGAGQYDRIRRGTLQALGMVSILAILAAGTGLLLTRGDFCYHVFLSADKVTPDAVRYGNSLLYVDFSMYLFLGFVFVVRNCVQGIGRSGFVLGAGAAELVARITVCLVLPGLFAGGAVSADAPAMAFYALCAADPMAWIAADTVLCIPFFRNILKKNYGYLRSGRA